MSSVVDSLETEFVLRNKYSGPARGVVNSTQMIDRAIGDALRKAKEFSVAGAAAIGAGFVALGVASIKSAADMERLEMALSAAVGPENVAGTKALIEEIAKLPGLGMAEATMGFTQLFTVMKDAGLVTSILKNMGNAVATVGGGREDLERVIVNMMQVAGSGKLMGDELREISMIAPQFREAMQKVFGTTDGAALAKQGYDVITILRLIDAEMTTMPRVAGGFSNSMENIGDTISRTFAAIGKPLLEPLRVEIEGIATSMEGLGKSNVLGTIGQQFADMVKPGQGVALFNEGIAWTASALLEMPTLVKNLGSEFTKITTEINKWVGPLTAIGDFLMKPIKDGIKAAKSLVNGTFVEDAMNPNRKQSPAYNFFDAVNKRKDSILSTISNPGPPAPPAPIPEIENGGRTTPMLQVASNTAKLVALQERQIQVTEMLLGGGAVARGSMSAVNLSRALGRSTPGGRQAVDAFFNAMKSEMINMFIQAQRVGSSPPSRR